MFFSSYFTPLGGYTVVCHYIILLYKSLTTWHSANSRAYEMQIFYTIYMLIAYQICLVIL